MGRAMCVCYRNAKRIRPGGSRSALNFLGQLPRTIFCRQALRKKPEACVDLGSEESFLHRSGAGFAEAGARLELKTRANARIFWENWN